MLSKLALAGALALACISAPARADETQSPWARMSHFSTSNEAAKSYAPRRHAHRHPHDVRVPRVSLAGVSAPLAAKAREIVAACGSTVISGLRHARVAGSGRMSLHASGRAVDLRGNPACIYRLLAGWPGGVSTDYGRVLHVHVSLGGREDGLRFAHGGTRSRPARHSYGQSIASR